MELLIGLFFAVIIGVPACCGQLVECYFESNSCNPSTPLIVYNSPSECCQTHPNNPTTFKLFGGTPDMCTSCQANVTFGFKSVGPVKEDSNQVEICVVLQDGDIIDTNITIMLNTMDGSAMEFNDYYPLSDEQLVFSSGDTEKCVNISVVNDEDYEGLEYFSVTARSNGLISENLTVFIVDSDMVVIGISDPSPIIVSEADPRVSIRIEVMSGKLETEIDLLLSTVDISAIGKNDYIPLSNVSVSLSGQRTFESVEVELKEDNMVEGLESFKVSLELSSPGMSGVMLNNQEKIVTIRDNDRATIGFITTTRSIGEESPSIDVCFVVKSGDIAKDISMNISVSGQAVEGEDFSDIVQTYIINGSISEGCIILKPVDDDILEVDEVTSIVLNTEDGDTDIDINQFEITIVDNEEVEFRFSDPSKVYSEGRVNETLCVEMIPPSGGLDRSITVTVQSQSFSDIRLENQNLIFSNSHDLLQCALLTAIDDALFEANKTVIFLLSSNDRAAVINEPLQSLVFQDNDIARFGFKAIGPVREDSNVVEVCVISLDGDIIRTVVPFTVNTVDGTAIEFNDYYPLNNEQLVFFSGDTEQCVNVTIVDDEDHERREYFGITVTTDFPFVYFLRNLTVNILDNDVLPAAYVCSISNQLLLETFHLPGSNGFVYEFSEGCEHILLSTCDPVMEIEIRIDYLHSNFSSGLIFVSYKDQKVVIDENNAIKQLTPDHPNIVVNNENDVLNINLTGSGISLALGMSFLNVYFDGFSASFLPFINGLCGSLDGELLLKDCKEVANVSDGTAVDNFIDSYKVKQTELVLRPQRMECGLTGNSTVVGDPLFTVPILPAVSDITEQKSISLCYEIHGESGTYFNLISDECTTVNAHYLQPPTVNYLNIINLITIIAVDDKNQCHTIQVNVDGCTSSYDGIPLARRHNLTAHNASLMSPFSSNGIEIKLYSSRVYISVPNCADLPLSMWVACQNPLLLDPYTDEPLSRVPMLKFVVNGGLNIKESSHGLIGQFWNIPVNITRFSGQLNSPEDADTSNYYTVSVKHNGSPLRHFVSLAHFLTWSHEGFCLYAGNKQGGPIGEVDDPNDPVIEGNYRDYIVNSGIDTEFKYSHFKRGLCEN